MSEATLVIPDHGSPEQSLVIQLCELFRSVVAETCPDEEHAAEHNSYAMTAACMFAGSLFGTMIYAGMASDQDKRRVTESMMRNFLAGIDVGKRRGARVEQEMREVGHS